MGGPVIDLVETPGLLGTDGALGAGNSAVLSRPAATRRNAFIVNVGGSK